MGSTILHRSCKSGGEGGCHLFEGAHFTLWVFLVDFYLSSGLRHTFASIGKFYVLSRLLQLAQPKCRHTLSAEEAAEREAAFVTGSVWLASVVSGCCLERSIYF